ncbi:MAG: DmsE family decaheme c-type cytochrome [Acidobacteriota bacterium]
MRVVLGLFALAWVTAVVVSAAGRPAPAQSAVSQGASAGSAASSPSAQAGGFVGDDTCIACHESEGKTLRGTLHGKAQNARTPAAKTGQACESCHGPGQAHVDTGDKTKIKVFTAMSPKDANSTCLTCHSKGSHAQWNGGMHDARNVACVTCHSVHSAKSERGQLKTVMAVETCQACHKQEAMKVKKSGHMPVREGKMDCTSCHTPHGSTNVRMLKVGNTLNETCASCHAEKRGPFLHDHAAGRENCASCHDPHGSNNDRMLIAKEPMLCQRCHVSSRHPATIYDGTQIAAASNRAVGRSCVNCHSQIHGSNHPAGGMFLR